MSYAAGFDRKTELVADLEGVMDEAFDQRASVSYPALPPTARRISVAHAEFTSRWQIGAIASVVIKSAGSPVGVLTLEKAAGQTFDQAELQTCEFLAGSHRPSARTQAPAAKPRWRPACSLRQECCLPPWSVPGSPALELGVAAAILCLAAFISFYPCGVPRLRQSDVRARSSAPRWRRSRASWRGAGARRRQRQGGQDSAAARRPRPEARKLKWESEREKLIRKHREALAKRDRTACWHIGADRPGRSAARAGEEKLRAHAARGAVRRHRRFGRPVADARRAGRAGQGLFELAPLDSYRRGAAGRRARHRHVARRAAGELAADRRAPRPCPSPSRSSPRSQPRKTAATSSASRRSSTNAAPLRPGMEGMARSTSASAAALDLDAASRRAGCAAVWTWMPCRT